MRISDWSSDVCSSDLLIFARVVVIGIRRPSGRTLAEEQRGLSDGARPAHRRAAAGRDLASQHVADRIAGLGAEKPCGENGVGLFGQPGNGQRASREQDRDHWLAELVRTERKSTRLN